MVTMTMQPVSMQFLMKNWVIHVHAYSVAFKFFVAFYNFEYVLKFSAPNSKSSKNFLMHERFFNT